MSTADVNSTEAMANANKRSLKQSITTTNDPDHAELGNHDCVTSYLNHRHEIMSFMDEHVMPRIVSEMSDLFKDGITTVLAKSWTFPTLVVLSVARFAVHFANTSPHSSLLLIADAVNVVDQAIAAGDIGASNHPMTSRVRALICCIRECAEDDDVWDQATRTARNK